MVAKQGSRMQQTIDISPRTDKLTPREAHTSSSLQKTEALHMRCRLSFGLLLATAYRYNIFDCMTLAGFWLKTDLIRTCV